MPKNEGAKGQFNGRDASGGTQLEPPENHTPTLAEIGISYKQTEVLADLEHLPKAPKVAALFLKYFSNNGCFLPSCIFDVLLWLNRVMGTRQLRRGATTLCLSWNKIVIIFH